MGRQIERSTLQRNRLQEAMGVPTSALLSPQKPAPQPMRTIFVISPRFICRATAARAFRLIKVAGYHHETAQTGAVTLVQRFGSALNLLKQP